MHSLPRTAVYGLPLIGIGTPSVESLRSYVQRLAQAHNMSTNALMFEMAGTTPNFGGPRGGRLHSVGDRQETALEKISLATGIALAASSLARFGHLLPSCMLIRGNSKDFRYCPLCVREPNDIEQRHGRLLWEVAAVDACPVHGTRLNFVANCGTPIQGWLRLNERPSLPTVCGTCGRIGFGCQATIKRADESAIWVATEVGKLLALDERTVKDFTPEQLRAGIADTVRMVFDDMPTMASRRAGIGRTLVLSWIRGDSRPSLAPLLRFAMVAGASVPAMFRGEFARSAFTVQRVAPKTKYRAQYRRIDWRVVTAELERALASEGAPESPLSFAERLQVDYNQLRKKFPDSYMKLKKQYEEFCEIKLREKRLSTRDAYYSAAAKLSAEGKAVTQNRLQEATQLWCFSGSKDRARGRALEEVVSQYRSAATQSPNPVQS